MSMPDENEVEAVIPRFGEPVAGWLLVFCLLLIFAFPALFLYSALSTVVPRLLRANAASEQLLLTIYLAVFTVVMLFGVAAGFNLWMIKPGAVALARRFLWTYLISHISYFILFVLVLRPRQAEILAAIGWYHVVGPIGSFYLWFVYLEHSRRVRRTYPVP
jgi:hypothetical protein